MPLSHKKTLWHGLYVILINLVHGKIAICSHYCKTSGQKWHFCELALLSAKERRLDWTLRWKTELTRGGESSQMHKCRKKCRNERKKSETN